MADQRPEEAGSRTDRGGLVVQAKKYLVYTWEFIKAIIGALVAVVLTSFAQVGIFGFSMFYFGMLAYRELDGGPAAFAVNAVFTLLSAVLVFIELRKLYWRWNR